MKKWLDEFFVEKKSFQEDSVVFLEIFHKHKSWAEQGFRNNIISNFVFIYQKKAFKNLKALAHTIYTISNDCLKDFFNENER